MIDALYLAENLDYARHVIQLAEQTQDPDLSHLVKRLKSVLNIAETGEDSQAESVNPIHQDGLILVEPDEEDIYRAQVSHRYIGALR